MERKFIVNIFAWLIMVFALFTSVSYFSKNYILATMILIIGILICVLNYFEGKKIVVEKVALIAILSAFASVGRIIFSGIPSVQPSSFIIIMAGICFGKEIGLLVGINTALTSNLVLGQGPWTPWQMFLWGLMGFMSALLAKPLMKHKFLLAIYGFTWGFIFGWVMNLWFITGYASEVTILAFLASCVSSFYFDLAHAVSNLLLIIYSTNSIWKVFNRISKKYKISD